MENNSAFPYSVIYVLMPCESQQFIFQSDCFTDVTFSWFKDFTILARARFQSQENIWLKLGIEVKDMFILVFVTNKDSAICH